MHYKFAYLVLSELPQVYRTGEKNERKLRVKNDEMHQLFKDLSSNTDVDLQLKDSERGIWKIIKENETENLRNMREIVKESTLFEIKEKQKLEFKIADDILNSEYTFHLRNAIGKIQWIQKYNRLDGFIVDESHW